MDDGLYACGTCRLNRKGWSDSLHKNCLNKQEGNSKFCQQGNLVAASWFDNRRGNFLSTNSDPTVTVNVSRKQKDGSRRDIKAPQVVESYNRYMSGVDHGDQLRMQFSTTRRCKKFWKYLFWFLVATAVACALILTREPLNHQPTSKTGNAKSVNQLGFCQNLARQLIGNYRQKRRHEATEHDSSGRSNCPPHAQI